MWSGDQNIQSVVMCGQVDQNIQCYYVRSGGSEYSVLLCEVRWIRIFSVIMGGQGGSEYSKRCYVWPGGSEYSVLLCEVRWIRIFSVVMCGQGGSEYSALLCVVRVDQNIQSVVI